MNKRLLSLLLAWGVTHQLFAQSFTTNIVDGFPTNVTGDFVLGDTGPYNFLLITNAGAITNFARSFIGNTVEAHNNMAIVAGTGSVWHLAEAAYVGLRSPSNTLAILDGANVRALRLLAMGTYETASNNFLHISGAGTELGAEWLHFGTYGPGNQLLIENSANVQIGGVIFNTEGNSAGGRQAAIVRGAGTRLSVTNILQMGASPANMLSVLDSAALVSGNATIGTGRSTNNLVVVSGPGSEWWTVSDLVIGSGLSASNSVAITQSAKSQSPRLFVGQAGTDNSYSIESGGLLNAAQTLVGEQASATRNRLLVTGLGSAISNSSTLTVGQSGSHNSFVLSNGATAWSGRQSGLGMQFTSSNNHAIATGTNTLWLANGLTVGSAGDFNTLSVDDGANVFGASLLSGGQGGTDNVTRVRGPGSLLSLTNSLDVSGANSLIVTNRARVESGSGVIGSFGSGGTALIDNASWSNAHSLTIGAQASDNLLRVTNNGRLYSSNAVIGVGDFADHNQVDVSGKGSSWRVLNDLNVGAWGDTNELAVLNGASISANSLNVGGYFVPAPPAMFPSDANTALIHGANTVVNIASNITLGYNGSRNHLEVRAGADLTSRSAEVATRSASADNVVLISDPGTSWHNTNAFVLGINGYRNLLIVSNRANLRTGPTVLGATGVTLRVSDFCSNQFGFNQAVLVGTGTVWQVDGELTLGPNSASNAIIVKQGALLRGADISIGQYGGTCSADIGNLLGVEGATLNLPSIFVAPRGQFRMLSGRADIGSLWVEVGQPGRVQILGGTLRPGSMYASAPAQIEIGDGVRRATLELIGGAYFSSGRIIVASNSVVAGRGSIDATNAGTYGTFGAIAAITNATLQGCSGFDVRISALGPGTGHSVLNLAAAFGTPVLNGRLRVALNPSFQPQASNEFPIVMFTSATGSFSNAPHESRLKTVDNLASFLVLYRANAVVLTDYRSTDFDGDAIEDAWATNLFGHSPLTAAEKSADADGDGMSNYNEFRAGTDPTNAASALRVAASVANGTATLQWPCVDGKTYRVYFSSDMRTWREVAEPTLAFPEAGLCQWTDDGRDAGFLGAQMRFYRVAVQ